jgi:hypothetical protein
MIPIDFIEKLMQADITTCDDYDRAYRARWGNVSPEERLMIAVVQDALNVLDGKVTAGTHSIASESQQNPPAEAAEWILSDDDDYVFSFVNICQKFSIDPEAARAAIVERYGIGKKRAA